MCPNNGCDGFRLVGNKSTNFTALCFEEDGGDLKDLFICNDFKNIGDEISTMKFLAFNIDEDEEAGFAPSVEYLILLQKSEQAIEEIINKEESFLSFDEITSWHIKHFELWENVLDDLPVTQYGKFYNFLELYLFTIRLIKYFKSQWITKSIKKWARKTNFENTHYYRVVTNKKDDFALDFFEIKVHKDNGLEYIKISQDYNIFLRVKEIEDVPTLKNIIDSFRKFSMLVK